MSVIIGRALPDVRDGLKPVHRRILFGMWEQGSTQASHTGSRRASSATSWVSTTPTATPPSTTLSCAWRSRSRCAICSSMVRATSARWTATTPRRCGNRVRLARLTEEMLGDDLGKETVDWTPNYDGSLQRACGAAVKVPKPARQRLVRYRGGHGTNIPPHNLGEVIDACVALAATRDRDDELIKLIPGLTSHGWNHPWDVRNTPGVHDGPRLRPDAGARPNRAPEERRASRHHHQRAAVSVNKARLGGAHRRARAGQGHRGISDLRDESDRDGIRVVVDLKARCRAAGGAQPALQAPPMQSSFGITFLAIVDNNRGADASLRC